MAEAKGVLDAEYLAPAKHGDLYRAVALLRPRAIGLVDGYFQWSAAVWHKEILWAIHQGVHVFGSSSMGALRAAELAPFGMRGVGRIFEAYRDGAFAASGQEALEDDDEVCVVHGPAESGYVAASEALVNIRGTLAEAAKAGLISERTRGCLLAIAKAAFFPERSFAQLLGQGRAQELPEAELGALERWLPAGRVNLKRADAIAMLETMRDFLAGNPPPARAGFAFEHTTLWERAVAALRPEANLDLDPVEVLVLDELRLDPARWESMRREVLRCLIGTEPAASEVDVLPATGKTSTTAVEGERLMERAARRDAARRLQAALPDALVERKLLALLRDQGLHERLRERAEDKQGCLALLQLPDVEEFSELQLLELRDWYFSQAVGAEMPLDIDRWMRDLGHGDLSRFHRMIFAEYVYRKQRLAEGGAIGGHQKGNEVQRGAA
jgi:hypothetical protein